ncbi:hypothetical protein ACFLTC_02995 [Chloroflexota bacterium]
MRLFSRPTKVGPVAATIGLALAMALAATIALAATGELSIPWWSVDGGGATFSEGGDYRLGGSIGQPDAGVLSEGDYTLVGGFWASAPSGPGVCIPISGVTISGPSSGQPDTGYTFSAELQPVTASLPITYTWSPEPYSGQGTPDAGYTWTTTGTKQIDLDVENCDGTGGALDSHNIEINLSQNIYLPLIVRNN